MANADISADVLRIYFKYDPATGFLYRFGERTPSGRIATNGYRQIFFQGKRYMAHRLAWLYVYGEWPKLQIDHINQCRDDNRIDNLREVTNKQNGENVRHFSHNTSGRRGVSWAKAKGQWQADIKHHGKTYYLGSFDNIIDAVAARMKAEKELFTHAPDYSRNYARPPETREKPRGSTPAPGTKT